MRFIWLFLSVISPFLLKSQYKVVIRVASLPSSSPPDIYISGSFNNWNPADAAYKLLKDEQGYFLQLPLLKAGRHQFKFTTGSWNGVEANANGTEMQNRVLEVFGDTTLQFSISAWKTEKLAEERKHTMSPNVKVLDTVFYIPQLKRTRRIWIYLPANYTGSGKHYPVLYMHDGQNLFDEHSAYSGEWEVDETLDRLSADCIVVGIDNSTKRMNEYNINSIPRFGKGEGRQYLEFIIRTLKPYIDKNFRTLSSRQTTFMAGSSMGALITLYAGLYYPEVFGGLGIFSPAFSVAPELNVQTKRLMKESGRKNQQYYFYAGGAESETMVAQMLNIFQIIHQNNKAGMKAVIRSQGQHNEARWKIEFPEFYLWMIKATSENF